MARRLVASTAAMVDQAARDYLAAMADSAPTGRVAHFHDAGAYCHVYTLCRPPAASVDRIVVDEVALDHHRRLRGGR